VVGGVGGAVIGGDGGWEVVMSCVRCTWNSGST